jgi:hypothetical protein
MKLKYISDNKGVTTGVYIPITEWNALKNKYQDIEEEEADNVPQWHKDIVLKRLKEYQDHPEIALDFDVAMEEIEKRL